ncbi:hypothetical protein [Streptococcus azizii]|nr:hypothetical protein [Streptococcus azizii]MBF0777040.1 hypothetical protein [Streptococcus sp. 19428wD3_AN2]
MGSPVAGVHRGLAPQMYDMPVVLGSCFGFSQLQMRLQQFGELLQLVT